MFDHDRREALLARPAQRRDAPCVAFAPFTITDHGVHDGAKLVFTMSEIRTERVNSHPASLFDHENERPGKSEHTHALKCAPTEVAEMTPIAGNQYIGARVDRRG